MASTNIAPELETVDGIDAPSELAGPTEATEPTSLAVAEQIETITFADLGLSEAVLRAVTDAGYLHPTPIQAEAVPVALKGRDMIGLAQTGTGKTAAFTLPIVNRLIGGPRRTRALILTDQPDTRCSSSTDRGESSRCVGRHLTRYRSRSGHGSVRAAH